MYKLILLGFLVLSQTGLAQSVCVLNNSDTTVLLSVGLSSAAYYSVPAKKERCFEGCDIANTNVLRVLVANTNQNLCNYFRNIYNVLFINVTGEQEDYSCNISGV